MTEIVLPVLTGLLLVLSSFAAMAVNSLRDFSRSRLEEICRAQGREARFGVILKRHEEALLAVDLLFVLVTFSLVACLFAWIELWRPATFDVSGWTIYLFELVLAATTILIVSVVLPWAVARVCGESLLFRCWPMLTGVLYAARPFVALTRSIDKFAHRLSGVKEPRGGDASTLTEEIRTVVDEGQREGVLESEARTMIHRVMELQEEDTAAIMTPRTEMDCISADSTLEEARRRLLEVGHSRVPVIGETTDDIIGILYAKDLLKHLHAADAETMPLSQIVREPFYVPETTGIDTLLETMKRERVHLAIVLDEYSGVAGLVTMEDILEEIVGEIVDEYDAAEEDGVNAVAPGVTEVEARVHIDDLNEQFGFDLPEDGDFDTIGGFVFSQLGRVPKAPESFTWRQLRITVLEADKRKLHRLRIEVDQSLAAHAADEG